MRQSRIISALLALFATLFNLSSALADAQRVFFADDTQGKIFRVDRDGENLVEIYSSTATQFWLFVDSGSRVLYFMEKAGGVGAIYQVGFDGANLINLQGDIAFPTSFTVDLTNGRLYWVSDQSDSPGFFIERSNLDGSSVVNYFTEASSFDDVNEMRVDSTNGFLYWTQVGANNVIRRAPLSNSAAVQSIINPDGQESAVGMTIDIEGGNLYWSEPFAGKIFRANLDGANSVQVLAADLSSPQFIEIDPSNTNELYFSNTFGHQLERLALSTGIRTILASTADGLSFPASLSLLGPISFTPGESIAEPPEVVVLSGSRVIELTLIAFGSSEFPAPTQNFGAVSLALPAITDAVRYLVTVKNTTTNQIKKVVTKSSKLRINLASAGTYQASYNIRTVQKRSKEKKLEVIKKANIKIADLKKKAQTIGVKNKIETQKSLKALAAVKTLTKSAESPTTPTFEIE